MNNISKTLPLPPGGVIRQLRPSDLPRFRDHLLRLDGESRRDRFNGPSNDHFIEAYAERSFHNGAIVVGYVVGDRVLGAAELHERPEDFEPTGEIIGGLLFERLIGHARALGYTRLRVTTHPQNHAMKRLARKFDARLTFEDGETLGLIELDPLPELVPAPVRRGGALSWRGKALAAPFV
jgi:RimJ/RimL family protein N-acetyltransferase